MRPVRMITRLLLSALTATSAATVVAPTAAHATGRPYVSTSSADMFWCTSTQSICANQTVTTVPGGTPMTMVCWRDDRQPFPSSSPRWFYVFLDNGQEGYLWAPQVADQTPNTPNCNTVNWINVADWAIGRIGLTQWRSAEADGPVAPTRSGNYWSGYCQTFASNAWRVAGGGDPLPGGSATAEWNNYAAQGRVDPGHRPPRGAMVYWNIGAYGHVAISLGNWRVIGTQGDQPQILPIADSGVSSYANFRGWTMPQASAQYNTLSW